MWRTTGASSACSTTHQCGEMHVNPSTNSMMFETSTYRSRRRQLVRQGPDSGLVLLIGNGPSPKNYEGNPYPFRQDSTFLYYFGLDRPNLFATIDLDAGTSTLYGEDAQLETIVWSGRRPSLRDAADASGVPTVASPSDLEEHLTTATRSGRPVHFLPPYRDEHRCTLERLLGIRSDRVGALASEPLIRAIVHQRSRKTEEEVSQIEQALDTTAQIHEHAMRRARPGVMEYEIVGDLKNIVASKNVSLSFTPTCSTRGEVLHNHSYSNRLQQGDLLLLDAGASSPMHYAGDITRVTPVGGSFTDRQSAIYDAVLSAQIAGIKALEPGIPFKEVHLNAARTLTEHLVDIGLMRGDPEAAVAAGAHALFFPHGLGHMLGLDAHDMENLGEEYVGYGADQTRSTQFGLHTLRLARPVRPGFVVTIEPGCYFIPPLVERWQQENRHERFINYELVEYFLDFGGIRIEDNVLITQDGARVLGPDIPKDSESVERLASAQIEQ